MTRESSPRWGDWEPVIGLEVHAQMRTVSKLFCGCPTTFGARPNANTCPVCLGLAGVLPVLNRTAVDYAIRTALATGCTVAATSRWARKNYFYPDLPKGYQISMYDQPLAAGGSIEFVRDGVRSRIRLTRIHMEEDAGKSVHGSAVTEAESFVDLNRAGVPLMEIVSEPDIRCPQEAAEYLRTLRSILQYLEVCDGNMEEGSLRCDANVSVRRRGTDRLGTRAEIKNINSFRGVERAIEVEIERQIDLLESGGAVKQETRLWDADRERTAPMRSKEDAHDYRYFPDPDLPPLRIEPERIATIEAALPELPAARRQRFEETHGLPPYDAEVLTMRRDLADYFEESCTAGGSPKTLANWILSEVWRVVRERRLDDALRIESWPVAPASLAALVALIEDGTISGKIAKTVFEEMTTTGEAPAKIVESRGLRQVSDEGAITSAVDEVLASHPDKVAELRGGKEKLLGFFVGQVMKATAGKANPALVNQIIARRLADS